MVNRSFEEHVRFAYGFASNKNRLLAFVGVVFLTLLFLVFALGIIIFSAVLEVSGVTPANIANVIFGLGAFLILFLLVD